MESAQLLPGKIVVIHARSSEPVQAEVFYLRLSKRERIVAKRVDAVNEPAFFAEPGNEPGIVIPFSPGLPDEDQILTLDLFEK